MKIFNFFLSINDKKNPIYYTHTWASIVLSCGCESITAWSISSSETLLMRHHIKFIDLLVGADQFIIYMLSSDHRGCDMYKNAHTPCLLGASMLNSAALCHLHHGTGQISRLKHKQTPWLALLIHTSQDTPCLPEQLHDQSALPLLLGRCWAVIGCLKMILKKGDRAWACSVDALYPIRDNLTKT